MTRDARRDRVAWARVLHVRVAPEVLGEITRRAEAQEPPVAVATMAARILGASPAPAEPPVPASSSPELTEPQLTDPPDLIGPDLTREIAALAVRRRTTTEVLVRQALCRLLSDARRAR